MLPSVNMRSGISLTVFVRGMIHLYIGLAQSNIIHSNVTGSGHKVKEVLSENFPDPCIAQVDGTWFAFATSGNGQNIQVAASSEFVKHSWRLLKNIDVLPDPGPWSVNDSNVWAPDVVELVSFAFTDMYGN